MYFLSQQFFFTFVAICKIKKFENFFLFFVGNLCAIRFTIFYFKKKKKETKEFKEKRCNNDLLQSKNSYSCVEDKFKK